MAKNRIKELRKSKEITLTSLSEMLAQKGVKVNASQLSKFEKGINTPRRDDVWVALADIFEVTPAYLRGYDDGAFNYPTDDVSDMVNRNNEIKLMLAVLLEMEDKKRISDILALSMYASELSQESWDFIKKSAKSIASLENNGDEDYYF